MIANHRTLNVLSVIPFPLPSLLYGEIHNVEIFLFLPLCYTFFLFLFALVVPEGLIIISVSKKETWNQLYCSTPWGPRKAYINRTDSGPTLLCVRIHCAILVDV